VNAGKYKTVFHLLLVLVIVQAALADSARVSTSQACPELVERGNKLYKQGNFNEAINSYDQALLETPGALEPKFNQANSYYRLDDLGKAMDLYRQVTAESKDMKHVARAKYNLGNSYFQQGSKQKDSNPQKAIDDLKTAIGSWRGVLDIEPENKKAAKNIEVARLLIKDLLDQLNKQQQDPNQPQDPNQQQQQQNQQQQNSQQDPNQPQDQQQKQQAAEQDPNQPQDPNQSQDQQQKQQQEDQKEQQQAAPDTTAQEILDKEQRQRKERQILQRGPWQKVEKDW
jgi:Ca-activated chloride channel family protein